MPFRQVVCLGIFCLLSIAAKPRPEVAIPTTEPGIVTPSATDIIPEPTLQQMYRDELGTAYDPVQASQLQGAHQLLEQFFHARTAIERKSVVGQLDAMQIDANVLGRLCRIRSHWPALAGNTVYYVNQKSAAYNVRYFFGVPKSYGLAKPWPLVIRLPTTTAFLTTPPPTAQGVVQIYSTWIHDELSQHPDAVVVMPLLNLDELYGPSYTGMNSVALPLRDIADRVNIDPARVYMVGHSMAAHGVWNLALHYPTYFAAINPMAGSANEDWQRLRLMDLRNVLPVVWHDDSDAVLKVNFSKSLVTAMRELKLEVVFDETKGIGHVPTDEIVQAEYAKLRSRTRNLYPPQVWLQTNRPDVLLNRNDWVQIDQELDSGKERRLFFRHGTGHMTVYDKSCTIKADVINNQITATSDNVDSMRFYVNDQMVNMATPVTVMVNKKVKFQGIVKPKVATVLNDQLYLGRGWRYYSGVIEIAMVDHPTTQSSTQPTTQASHKGRILVGPAAGEP